MATKEQLENRKWKKYKASKRMFPTKFLGGSVQIGKMDAQRYIEKMIGKSVKDMKFKSTKTQWVWMEAL